MYDEMLADWVGNILLYDNANYSLYNIINSRGIKISNIRDVRFIYNNFNKKIFIEITSLDNEEDKIISVINVSLYEFFNLFESGYIRISHK
ncbi:hypothetical protein [Photobacterium kishitanii]|uniref:hypothetical protein n=1 Tax=Photobacterium kishitanii TaxID=318456 RepID=UPI0007F92F7D|nr:hypothetical protein [Photobacterium kishitanii]OBU29696.1 hypothetical protein AYY23_08145 [Photobacterium kishitanii]PSW49491.1 hypothetical protein C0W66_10270 [Photobacterium kishitanii]